MNWTFIRQVGPMQWAIRYSSLQFRKRVLKKDSYLKLPTGLTLNLPRHSGFSTEAYVTNANVDWGAESIFVQFADPRRDFLDIGSHFGYYSVYLAPRTRQVYAFEPNPRNFAALKANSALASNIEVVEAAVSSYDGSAQFFCSEGTATGSLSKTDGPQIETVVTTVDTFATAHPGIDVGLVKIDVEGHDFETLLGMRNTIKKYEPLVLTECSFSAELVDFCKEFDYRVFGFISDRETLKRQFQEFTFADFDKWHKMLFLVPTRFHSAFENMTRNK